MKCKLIHRMAAICLISAFLISTFPSNGRPPVPESVHAADISQNSDFKNLSEVEKASEKIYAAYLQSISGRKNELASGKVTIGKNTIRISMKKIGTPEKNGYPLYIALRGGGNEDEELAEEQFQYMKNYGYSSAINSGIYVVTQPITCSWDEHYRPEMFRFYDKIIEDAVAFCNADPNRVYLLGFSSGGDGVYSIAPRIADRFAAVNMSAGLPHILQLGNLYQLPMCIQAGELDSAYERNLTIARYNTWLNEYAKKYGGGFPHEAFLHAGGSHNSWSDVSSSPQKVITGQELAIWLQSPAKAETVTKNTSAVDWVNAYTRNPIPERVIWEPSVNAGMRTTQAFYWLDRNGDLPDTTIIASYNQSKNSVSIEQCDAKRGTLKIYLNPQMLDVFKEVNVTCNGISTKVLPIVSRQIMKSTLKARGDINYMFTSEIDITFNGNAKPEIEAVDKHTDLYIAKEKESMLSWNEEGIFYVDQSLFNCNYNTIAYKLGIKLDPPISMRFHNVSMSGTTIQKDGNTVVFLFQNNKCKVIYSEKEGSLSEKMQDAACRRYGEQTGVYIGPFTTGGISRYYIEEVKKSGKTCLQQLFVSYDF